MLVCTPSPMSTESLFGYILRVSETNGYETPRNVLNYAGYGSGEMRSAVFDVNRLAKVLGRRSSELKKIAYSVAKRNGSRDFKILNHKLVNSKKLPKGFLRLSKPMICPQCVKEDGAIDVFWDLHFAVACPIHSVLTLRKCPKCKKNINWFRPGLLKCHCGESFTNDTDPFPVGAKLVTMMAIIKEKLYGHSIKKLENSSKFPVNELDKISFFSLNWLIEVLGKYNVYSKSLPETANSHLIVMEAADVLSDWPNEYHSFLIRLGTRFSGGRGYKTTGLREQFKRFYLSIFESKSLDKADSRFLRDEFLTFGFEHWGKAVVDNKLLKNTNLIDMESRFQNKSKAANELGISPVTLGNWLEKGLVKYEEVVRGNQVKYILDKQALGLEKRMPGKTFEQRGAANFLQIPVSVLVALKKTGYYPVEHLPKHIPGFHEADLKSFFQIIIEKSSLIPIENVTNNHISLDYILQEKRFWSKKGKAKFVSAYLDGEILAVGRTGNSLKEIWFNQVDVDNFLSKSRMKTNDKTISQDEAAKVIGCNLYSIPVLISNGSLIGVTGPNRVRVRYESVIEFVKHYLSFTALSKKLNTSSKRLFALCQNMGIETLSIKTKKGNITSFIKKEKIIQLKYQIDRNPTREMRQKIAIQEKVSSIMKLKYYLKHLKKKDLPLPRFGFKPNNRGIAKACGISRGVFYNDCEIIKLLEAFDIEERERREIDERNNIDKLKTYLEEVIKNNKTLPIAHKGKPNKVAIAQACGISRNVFYENSEVTAFLDAYVNEV